MNKLLATLIAGAFAVASTAALAQQPKLGAGLQKAEEKNPKGTGTAYQNPAAEPQRGVQAGKEDAKNVKESKAEGPRPKVKYDEKAAQKLTDTSPTVEAQKGTVAASKAESPKRQRMPDIKSLTPEERAQLRRELDKLSTP
jgi:hypothetical protein